MALNSVPLSNQTLAVTQPLIKNNFDTIDSVFAIDHATFNTTNAGFHNKLTMPQQNPAPTGVSGMGLIYYFTDGNFYINNNNTTPIPFTKFVNVGGTGYTYLPSGLILQWGNYANPAAGLVIFPLTFPNAAFSVTVSNTFGTNYTLYASNLNQTNFLSISSVVGFNVGSYFAIGR